jgi:kynurenine formamidase
MSKSADQGPGIRSYAELLQRTDGPPGSSWGIFGADDELGTINFLTPERVVEAAKCVRRGSVFNLDCSLDAFDPPILAHRKTLSHKLIGNSPNHRDDYIDNFYLQSSSQVDGLRHFRHPIHGFYNHMPDAKIVQDGPHLGVNRFAEHGIVGRGVLIDVERYLSRRGERLDYFSGAPISVELVDATAKEQGVEFRPGDILMLRTGWMKVYFTEMSTEDRHAFPHNMRSPGLRQGHDTLAWIWDHQFALCASDNFALECHPPIAESVFANELAKTPGMLPLHLGMMHPYMIAMLGLAVGELWELDALADDCERDGVWDCLVTVKPLNLIGGVGSPANATAVK